MILAKDLIYNRDGKIVLKGFDMLRESVSIKEAIIILNSAVDCDHRAMKDLIYARVRCNKALADHGTIQVVVSSSDNSPPLDIFEVGVLGLLNGLFGIRSDGMGAIQAVFEIECPSACSEVKENHVRVGQYCPTCGSVLVLGKLIKFQATETKKEGEKR